MAFAPPSFVLADEIPIKFIGSVIILIIWGISSLVGAVNKANEENRRRKSKLAKPVVAVRPRAVAATRPRVVVRQPPPLPNRGQGQPALPPLPGLTPQAAAVRPALAPNLVAPPPAARAAVQPVTPEVIGQWMSQDTIRSQFLLAEVFRPPVALRDTLTRK